MKIYEYSIHEKDTLDPDILEILSILNIPPVPIKYDKDKIIKYGEITTITGNSSISLYLSLYQSFNLDSLHYLWDNNLKRIFLVYILY